MKIFTMILSISVCHISHWPSMITAAGKVLESKPGVRPLPCISNVVNYRVSEIVAVQFGQC